jgi:serine/threonine protein kinase/DNA-binding beta-propeller fold protein YncE
VGEELQPGDPERIGPYRVIKRLGSGGMGRVFLCRSAGGRPVAVKVIRTDLAADREFRTRFRREVDAARKVSGLYTALLVDADPDGPMPWLATAYVPGPSLADAVADQGPLPSASVLMLAAGLAESLTAIHATDLVHRDLKPSNVLLADDGPRVIDFGISRATEASALTHTGLVVGSPGFMSPEQAEGGQVIGPPSDVFSLGAVLTYAATGQGPFGAGSTAALIYRVVHGVPALDGISADLRALIERCLTKDPGMRPTAPDLLAELGDVDVAAGWLPAPLTKEVSAHASRAPQSTRTRAGTEQKVSRSPEPAFSRTVTRPSADRGGEGTPPRHPALVATLADPAARAVYAVTFGPEGDVLAAADANGRVYLWDVASSELAGTFADPASRGVIGVDFCPDGELLAAADDNGRVYLWDVVSAKLARTFARRRSQGMNGVAFGLGGDVLAAANDNGRVYLWDVVSGRLAGTFENPGSQGVIAVRFDRDTELLAAADDNGRVYLWDAVSGALATTLESPGSQGVNDVAFSPEGDLLAAADASGKVCVWNVANGQVARAFTAPDGIAAYAVTFAPDGGVLAVGDGDGSIRLWNMVGGDPAGTFEDPDSQGVNGVAFSPRGDVLAAADGNGHTYLWKTTTGSLWPPGYRRELSPQTRCRRGGDCLFCPALQERYAEVVRCG